MTNEHAFLMASATEYDMGDFFVWGSKADIGGIKDMQPGGAADV
jgi:hypothetical protein